MKKYWVLFFCLWASAMQAQTLRDAVVVVRPNYTGSTVKFLTGFSQSLRRDGYTAAADLLAAYSKGGYGTGFVWLNNDDGRYYVITNRHVVAQAKDVDIELMPADAPEVKYSGCRIVAVDEGSEMALIALPDTAAFAAPMAFAELKFADGDEVYTAGFPGLGGDPSWQLGKGIISNSSAKMKEWTVQKSAKVIQHTAQVDPGSSGGPLLVRNAGAGGTGYAVIGINTWQARNRENANFSIAATTMQEFISAHFSQAAPQSREKLQERAQGFAKAMKEGYRDVYPYLSDDYIANISVSDFYELLASLTDSVGAETSVCFGNGMPVDGVRIGLASALETRFGKKTLSYGSISNFTDSVATVVFSYGDTPVTSSWTFRNGEWAMSNFSALDMRDMAKSGIATSFGYKNAVLLGVGIPANSATRMHLSLAYEYTLSTFIIGGFNFGRGSFNGMDSDTTGIAKYTSMGIHAGLQLPVKAGPVYIIPNAKYYLQFGIVNNPDSKEVGTMGGYSAGINCAYKLKRKSYLIGGLQYKVANMTADGLSPASRSAADGSYITSNLNTIELVVGITF
ncbi:MAG: serine protease [Cytophagaceae bacterium]|jgi:serine protease Do|nr:serine protease [Cytophagaceae bacterium]